MESDELRSLNMIMSLTDAETSQADCKNTMSEHIQQTSKEKTLEVNEDFKELIASSAESLDVVNDVTDPYSTPPITEMTQNDVEVHSGPSEDMKLHETCKENGDTNTKLDSVVDNTMTVPDALAQRKVPQDAARLKETSETDKSKKYQLKQGEKEPESETDDCNNLEATELITKTGGDKQLKCLFDQVKQLVASSAESLDVVNDVTDPYSTPPITEMTQNDVEVHSGPSEDMKLHETCKENGDTNTKLDSVVDNTMTVPDALAQRKVPQDAARLKETSETDKSKKYQLKQGEKEPESETDDCNNLEATELITKTGGDKQLKCLFDQVKQLVASSAESLDVVNDVTDPYSTPPITEMTQNDVEVHSGPSEDMKLHETCKENGDTNTKLDSVVDNTMTVPDALAQRKVPQDAARLKETSETDKSKKYQLKQGEKEPESETDDCNNLEATELITKTGGDKQLKCLFDQVKQLVASSAESLDVVNDVTDPYSTPPITEMTQNDVEVHSGPSEDMKLHETCKENGDTNTKLDSVVDNTMTVPDALAQRKVPQDAARLKETSETDKSKKDQLKQGEKEPESETDDCNNLEATELITKTGGDKQLKCLFDQVKQLDRLTDEENQIETKNSRVHEGGRVYLVEEHLDDVTKIIRLLSNETNQVRQLEGGAEKINDLNNVAGQLEELKSVIGRVQHRVDVIERIQQLDNVVDRVQQLECTVGRIQQAESVTGRVQQIENVVGCAQQLVGVVERVQRVENLIGRIQQLENVVGRVQQLENITGRYQQIEMLVGRVQNLEGVVARVLQLENMASRVQQLEMQLMKMNASITSNSQGNQGCYTNWSPAHYDMIHEAYVSRADLRHVLWKVERICFKSKKDRNQIRKLLSSLQIFKINKATRFPVGEECVDIKDKRISKCMNDIYASLSEQDDKKTADELGGEDNKKQDLLPNLRFKTAVRAFYCLVFIAPLGEVQVKVDTTAVSASRSGRRSLLPPGCVRHTVESFEEAKGLMWQDK